ncbi:MAG: protein-glutamine gamma-glutamyltransferase [Clostridia bacterium]|nr:protein-glutamine gamma-glutamyltransferase [Clostridia bacterium]
MIRILHETITPDSPDIEYPPDSVEAKIINILSSSAATYEYDSLDELKFEVNLRKNIIIASRELNDTGFSFRTFRESKCNTEYWNRTNEGGFLLKEGVKPSDAIKDIFINSYKYGTECATAIVIVYYKALVNIYPEELFNEMFAGIHLMNWHYMDRDLNVGYYPNKADYLPGDCRYFKNPDVDPLTPQWQGENAIDLGDGTYYGHGIGITSGDGIINALNRFRSEGSTKSAYLLDSATRPDFKYLSYRYYDFTAAPQEVESIA